MRKVVQFTAVEIMPESSAVLLLQGMPSRDKLPQRIGTLLDSAMELFAHEANPIGIMEDISLSDFLLLYGGNGLNAAEGPVPTLVRQADGLALFAASLGAALSEKYNVLFTGGKASLAYMLNAVASSGAESLARLMGRRFLELFPEEKRKADNLRVLPYSPGHCGWHLSGQTKLFHALHPEEIGITLSANSAMDPLKSVSGVLVVGKKEIHSFKQRFSFCKDCREHKCIERIASIESAD